MAGRTRWGIPVAVAALVLLLLVAALWLATDLFDAASDEATQLPHAGGQDAEVGDGASPGAGDSPQTEAADASARAHTPGNEAAEDVAHEDAHSEEVNGDDADDVRASESGGKILGRVVNSDGGPVAQARVYQGRIPGNPRSLRRPPSKDGPKAVTDKEGLFRLPAHQWQRFRDEVVIRPPAPYAFAVHPISSTYTRAARLNEPGDETAGIPEFVVERGGGAHGVVTDRHGVPLVGATVYLGGTHRGSAGIWLEGPTANTDANGRYFLEGVLPGRESLTATAPDYIAAVQTDVEFRASSVTRSVDFKLDPLPALTVTVTDGRDPIPGATVEVGSIHSQLFKVSRETDEEGQVRFTELVLLERDARIVASKDEAENQVEVHFEEFDLEVELELLPPASLSLRPVDAETGAPILLERYEPGEIRGTGPAGFPHVAREASQRIKRSLDEDGTLRFANVQPGKHELAVAPVTHEEALITVTLEPGTETALGDVALTRGPLLRIEVVDGNDAPIEGARVVVRPASRRRTSLLPPPARDSVQGTTDAAGRFETPVASEGARIAVRHENFAHERQTVSDLAGQRVHEVRIQLHRVGSVVGTVYDTQGQPVPHREVSLILDKRRGINTRTTDEDGDFEFSGLEAGAYIVRAAPDSPTGVVDGLPDEDDPRWFRLEEGETRRKDVHLSEDPNEAPDDASHALSGVLLYHDGSPATQTPLEVSRRSGSDEAVVDNARTNARGEFFIAGTPGDVTGRVHLRVTVEPEREITLVRTAPQSGELGEVRLPPSDPEARSSVVVRVVDGHTGVPTAHAVRIRTVEILGISQSEYLDREIKVRGEARMEDLPPWPLRFELVGDVPEMYQVLQIGRGGEGEVELRVYASTRVTFHVRSEAERVQGERTRVFITTRSGDFRGPQGRGELDRPITLDGLGAGREYTATVLNVATRERMTVRFTPQQGMTKRIEVTFEE